MQYFYSFFSNFVFALEMIWREQRYDNLLFRSPPCQRLNTYYLSMKSPAVGSNYRLCSNPSPR